MSDIITIRGSRHVIWECGTCGVVSTCPERVYDEHREQGGFHHCPNGHQWGWTKDKSEIEKLRRERDRLTQRVAQKDDEIKSLENSRVALKGQITRIKNRVGKGVCPCCNRTFENLHRHMATKHPTYSAEAAE